VVIRVHDSLEKKKTPGLGRENRKSPALRPPQGSVFTAPATFSRCPSKKDRWKCSARRKSGQHGVTMVFFCRQTPANFARRTATAAAAPQENCRLRECPLHGVKRRRHLDRILRFCNLFHPVDQISSSRFSSETKPAPMPWIFCAGPGAGWLAGRGVCVITGAGDRPSTATREKFSSLSSS